MKHDINGISSFRAPNAQKYLEAYMRIGAETFVYLTKIWTLSVAANQAAFAGNFPLNVALQQPSGVQQTPDLASIGDVVTQTINLQTEWMRNFADLQAQLAGSMVQQAEAARVAAANSSWSR